MDLSVRMYEESNILLHSSTRKTPSFTSLHFDGTDTRHEINVVCTRSLLAIAEVNKAVRDSIRPYSAWKPLSLFTPVMFVCCC